MFKIRTELELNSLNAEKLRKNLISEFMDHNRKIAVRAGMPRTGGRGVRAVSENWNDCGSIDANDCHALILCSHVI